MSPYVEGGYLACLGTLGAYALALLRREQVARRRLSAAEGARAEATGDPSGEPEPS